MKQCSQDCGHYTSLVDTITHLPLHMLRYHDDRHLAHFLLYHLGHDDCFAFDTGAYLVDNPEFNCLKGCAGFTRGECDLSPRDVWSKPGHYGQRLQETPFNKKVQALSLPSVGSQQEQLEQSQAYRDLCSKLNIANPECISWPMKHGNRGLLIYNHSNALDDSKRSLLKNCASLLGFCPVS